MKEWFLSREPRERVILAVGAAVAVVIIGWQLIWVPLSAGVEQLDSAVNGQMRLLVDAQNAAAVAPQDASRPRTEQSLYVVVDRTARTHGIADKVTRTTQDGTTDLTIAFTAVPFDALIDWLVALDSEHGVAVETAQFNATQQAGIVNGDVTLRR